MRIEIIEQSFSRIGAEAFFRAYSQQTSRMFMLSVLGARYANPLFLHLTQREEKRKPFGAMWVGGDCRKFYIWPFSVNISVKEPDGHACEL
ncbi:hypothetical protein BDE02_06G197800 [Populus trichocarpa]|nr:hypothetical protein BDE02_06G197800 [Populus trichocarpa]